jgi:Flp pilus assembly protein TadD
MGFLLIQVVLRDSADLAVLNRDYASKYAQRRIAGLRQALRLNPDDASTHLELGVALQEEGSLDEAIRQYRRAIQIDVNLAGAHNNLGILLGAQGKLDEATGHYREAIRLRPEYATAHHNLGVLLGGQGKLDEAIRHYRQAVRMNDELGAAHNNLGYALAAQGNISEAIEHLRKAALLEAQPAPLRLLSLLLASHPDPQIRDPTEAIRLAERAAEMTGHRDPVVLDVLAAAYAADGHFDEAVRTATNAAALAAAAQAEELADQIRERLKLYQESKPYRLAPARAVTPP